MKKNQNCLQITILLLLSLTQRISGTRNIIVGIITMESTTKKKKNKIKNEKNLESILAKSYVDYISQTGAIPVIIPYDLPLKKLEKMVESVDMIFLPGGDMRHTKKSKKTGKEVLNKYVQRVDHIIQLAAFINEIEGRYFPLLGTCFNFETLVLVYSGYNMSLIERGADDKYRNHSITDFGGRMKISDFWGNERFSDLEKLIKESVLVFNHIKGVIQEHFLRNPVAVQNLEITSVFSHQGKHFVGSVEHKRYPFFATQFHPEKNQFELFNKKLDFVDRSYETTDMISFEITKLVQLLRGLVEVDGGDDDEIPDWLLEFSPLKMVPVVKKYYKSFEMVYVFPSYGGEESELRVKQVVR